MAGATFGAGPGAAGAAPGGGAKGLKPIMVFFEKLSAARAVAPGTALGAGTRAASGAGASALAIGAPHCTQN
jgi:hypothetical protein